MSKIESILTKFLTKDKPMERSRLVMYTLVELGVQPGNFEYLRDAVLEVLSDTDRFTVTGDEEHGYSVALAKTSAKLQWNNNSSID